MKNSHIALYALDSLLVSVPFHIRLHDWIDVYTYDFVRTKNFNQIFLAMARLSRARAPLKLFWYPNYSIVLVHFIGVFLVNSFVVTSLLNHGTLSMSNEIL